MKALTDYPAPETNYRKYKAFPPSGALGIGFDVVDAETARDLERRLAACREALEMIATFHTSDNQCDNGYGPAHNARKTLSLTAPLVELKK